MARYLFLLGILIVVITVYSVVDCAMIDNRRVRGLAKPVWIVVILILPVIGLVLWYLIGRGSSERARDIAPDDDPAFTGPTGGVSESDERIRRLEAELAALDEEIIRPRDQKPQTDAGASGPAADGTGGSGRGRSASADDAAGPSAQDGQADPDPSTDDIRPNEDDGHTTDHGRGKGPGSTDA